MGKKSRAKAARRENVKNPAARQADARSGTGRVPAGPPRTSAPRGVPGRLAPSPLASEVAALLSEGQPQAALSLLQRTPPARGHESNHRNMVAICLVALHEYHQAYPLLVAAEAEGGMTPDMLLAMAEAEANVGLSSHFERRIRRFGQAYPTHPALASAREYALSLQAQRETRAAKLGVDAAAVEEADFLRESSQLRLDEGDFAAAARLARQAVERCEADESAHLALVEALATSGDDTAAREALQWAVEHAAQLLPSAAVDAIRFCLALGLPDRAREVAAPLLAATVEPANRPWKADALAFLGEHQSIRELLRGARDLTARERFILGIASANLGDLPAARRELRAAVAGGVSGPFIHKCLEWADEGRTDLLYTSALDVAPLGLVQLFRRILRNNDPQAVQDLRAIALPGSPAMEVAERLLDENPPAGVQTLAAIGTPEALNRLQDFVTVETAHPADRIMALGCLRDAGEIAEDEPVDLPVQGETVQIVLGRHRIVPERPVSVPDQTAAELFDTAARSLSVDPEAAYSGFEALDEYYGESAEVKIRLARLSLESGRLDESRTWIEQALSLEPESVAAHITLASLCLLEGDLRGAIEQSRFVDAAETMTAGEVLSYNAVRESLNTMLESPLADALMAQADLAQDDESAEANRELAGMLGAMQKSLALTQYLRQRPVANLHEELTLGEVFSEVDDFVVYNAAWLFGLIPELESASASGRDVSPEKNANQAAGNNMDDDAENDASDELDDDSDGEEHYSEAARQMLARELLAPDRLAEGLPGMTEQDLDAAEWLLERGGISSLDDYLAAFPADETAPSDMLLEYGMVADGRLSGKLSRMVPVDLRSPLAEALSHRSEW